MIALLDVNVLVALYDPDHLQHDAAHDWLAASRSAGWATCPFTENGLVRILGNPAYSGAFEPPSSIRDRLDAFCASGNHVFWPDDVSLRDRRLFRLSGSVAPGQLTDVYLLGLACTHAGRLATFDRRIRLAAVAGARSEHLVVIPS